MIKYELASFAAAAIGIPHPSIVEPNTITSGMREKMERYNHAAYYGRLTPKQVDILMDIALEVSRITPLSPLEVYDRIFAVITERST